MSYHSVKLSIRYAKSCTNVYAIDKNVVEISLSACRAYEAGSESSSAILNIVAGLAQPPLSAGERTRVPLLSASLEPV